MKEVLDFLMLFGFIAFLTFLMRGFFLQIQDKEKKRKDKNECK